MTFKGNRSYSTIIGGIATIIIILFLIVFGIILSIKMFQRTNVQWDQNLVRLDFNINQDIINVTEKDDVIVQITFETSINYIPNGTFSEYSKIQLYQISNIIQTEGKGLLSLDVKDLKYNDYK